MKKHILILTLLLTAISYSARAQIADSSINQPKNVLYASVSSLGLWFTGNLNYERHIKTTNKKHYINYYARANGGAFATWGADGPTGSLSIQGVFGENKSHLELGLGLAVLFDKSGYAIGISNANYPYPGYEPEPTRLSYSLILPAITIGYRYQKPEGHLVFRTGIASPDGVYVALGAAF